MEFSLLDNWPKNADGTPEQAVLLCSEADVPDRIALLGSLLESFKIPYYATRPGLGGYLHVLFGRSVTAGLEVYVPASLLEDAKALMEAPPAFEDELPDTEQDILPD